jgi:hypothetical protein
MKATPELIRKVANAIGDIPARNTGIIGHPMPLCREMSEAMLHRIAQVAINAIPEPAEPTS